MTAWRERGLGGRELGRRLTIHMEAIAESRGWSRAKAVPKGSRVMLRYYAHKPGETITKQEAGEYLTWLEDGGEGSFSTFLRAAGVKNRG